MNVRLTMAAVAERIGVPVTTLRNWVYRPSERHSFPRPTAVIAKQRAGRRGYWDAVEVEQWRARHG